MRLLHVADLHLERPFLWLGPERGRERRAELRAALARVVALARERQVDALCIAGDLYERENATPAVGDFLAATFRDLAPIEVLISPGNHDYFQPGCLYDRVTWPNNVHIFDEPMLQPHRVADGTIWGMAFTSSELRCCPIDGFSAPTDGVNLGLFHADICATSQPSIYGPLELSRIANSGLRFVMLGHIHAGRVEDSYAYPGSIEPMDISESGNRWALLIETANGKLDVSQVKVCQRHVMSDTLDATGILTAPQLEAAIDAKRGAWSGNYVQLTVVGTLGGELEANPDVIRTAIHSFDVDLSIETTTDYDMEALAKENTVQGLFVRNLLTRMAGASPEDRCKNMDIILAGLAALSGQEVRLL